MFDYDGKRDRWNGYNPEEHMKIVEEYAKVDLVSKIACFSTVLKECAFCCVSNRATMFFQSWCTVKVASFL
jgi:hypothetical protein